MIYKENWSVIAEHNGFLKDFLESEAMLISKFLLNRTYNLYHWKVYHQIKTNIEKHVMSLVEMNSNSQARIIEAQICEKKEQFVIPYRRDQIISEKPEILTATKSAKQSKKKILLTAIAIGDFLDLDDFDQDEEFDTYVHGDLDFGLNHRKSRDTYQLFESQPSGEEDLWQSKCSYGRLDS